MIRLSLAASILALGTMGASAADLAARPYTKAPPVVAAAYDWSGFYIGANGGGAWSRKCWDVVPFDINVIPIPPFTVAGPEGCHTASGATAGGQVGYRWQKAAWVFGIEAQGNWANLTGSNNSTEPFFALSNLTNRTKIDAIGLFTGQIGYAWNSFLLYVKGGAAVVNDKYDTYVFAAQPGVPAGQAFTRGSETRWGGVGGVGGEYAFTRNWSFALEYDHLFMGNNTARMTADPFFIAQLSHHVNIRQDVDMLTARINYRFGGPVVAKY
jgi:outer membrane immunogenic protein